MQTELPGGAWMDGRRVRAAALRPVTGAVEQEILGALDAAASWPEAVSAVLSAAVERLGDVPCSPALVDALPVGDRQLLLLRVAAALHGDAFWCSARCRSCDAWFDLRLLRSALPVKDAGAGFPFADVECGGAPVRFRVPTGADQRAVVGLSAAEAERALLERCVVAPAGERGRAAAAALGPEDRARVDEALDAAAPDVGTRVTTSCPECGAVQVADVDPWGALRWTARRLYEEVHVVAATYHWSEAEILALPRARRRLYLDLIDRQRGAHQ